MATVNVQYVLQENQRLARMINDVGELLSREDLKLYEQVVLSNFDFNKKLSHEEERDFLHKLYNCIIDKLKEINFDKD